MLDLLDPDRGMGTVRSPRNGKTVTPSRARDTGRLPKHGATVEREEVAKPESNDDCLLRSESSCLSDGKTYWVSSKLA